MKKIKKLSALLLASVISSSTLSVLPSNAIYTAYSKDEIDNFLKDSYIISTDYGYRKNEIECLVKVSEPDSFRKYYIESAAPDVISAVLDLDVDADTLIYSMKEICPDAEVVTVIKENDSNVVCVKGVDNSNSYYQPYFDVREKDVTYDQAIKLHDLLDKTGKLKEFEYTKEAVGYSYGIPPMIFACDYGLTVDGKSNSVEKIEKYIAENNLGWTIKLFLDKEDPNSEYSYFAVNLNESVTGEEIYKLDEQLRKDLGLEKAVWSSPTGFDMPVSVTIDMHNNVKGDANDDDQLALSDAVAILQSIGNPDDYELTPQGEYNADITGDKDGITNLDALTVQRKLLKLE